MNLSAWHFSDEIDFTFALGTVLPAGVNTGEGPPTGVAGDSGFPIGPDGVTDWVVRDQRSVFAVVGVPAPEQPAIEEPVAESESEPGPTPPSPSPTPTTPEPPPDDEMQTEPIIGPLFGLCGVGSALTMLISLLGLFVLRGTQRGRT